MDFMASGLGVRHYHIGYNKITNDNLVFVLFQGNEAHLLTLGKHTDLYVESPECKVFEVLIDEYSDWANRWCPVAKGVTGLSRPVGTVQDFKALKVAGCTTMFQDKNGDVRMVINCNSVSRTPYHTFCLSSGIIQEVLNTYKLSREYKEKKIAKLISMEFVGQDPMLIFKIVDSGINYLCIKAKSETATGRVLSMVKDFAYLNTIDWPKAYDEVIKLSSSSRNKKKIAQHKKNLPPA
ncbi:hypothetical protein [Desulfovibrio sp. JC022]|uniref:hypothetical protein n=1 Tax=Desulfovibrio sp. JC022 TaxID=2593642 RepID=UPI0013D74181|nr:hypothetical protein [Desulfovibrio sp. JC022]NDV22640.1 hypothetical protein [Desulfovibrio sp. JC022]